MKIKGKDLFEMQAGLQKVGDLTGKRFAYVMSRNLNSINCEIMKIQTLLQLGKEYKEYDKKRLAFCKKHCKKDENGSPMIVDGNFVGLEGHVVFEKEIAELKEQYTDVIENRDNSVLKYKARLETEIDLNLLMIDFDQLPENITTQQMSGIMSMVRDPPKE